MTKKIISTISFMLIAFCLTTAYAQCPGEKHDCCNNDGSENFVTITDVVPDAILEIRYYSTYNFTGGRVDGYLQPVALMTRQAADSLKAVSDDLKAQGYRLKIYDAYRPQMAVDNFVRWAADLNATEMRAAFYPSVDKSRLFVEGYIAEKSGHTRGSTIDLSIIDSVTGHDVDMGSTFDWLGPESHPDYGGNPDTGVYRGNANITETQFRNRLILRQAMMRHGFKPLDTEWWHFTLKNEPFPNTYFKFPVRQLPNPNLCPQVKPADGHRHCAD